MSWAHILLLDQRDFIAEADLTNVLHFEKWHWAALSPFDKPLQTRPFGSAYQSVSLDIAFVYLPVSKFMSTKLAWLDVDKQKKLFISSGPYLGLD